tara:strand:+ start:1049 stop:2089 length:1041 start_codon:yes stop_codon:yes gene_type:complete
MKQPLVCVCVPCFNSEETIAYTIETIQNQTYKYIEIHIFDNASTDKTIEIIQSISDSRIQIHLAEFTGTSESNFNRCLSLGRGEYTTIFHADDLYAVDIIDQEVQQLEQNKNAGGILTFATQIDSYGKRGKTYLAPKSLHMEEGETRAFDVVSLFKALLKHENFLFTPSAMLRTSVCTQVIKEWNLTEFGSSADLDVWLRVAAYNNILLLNSPLLFYRISEIQLTASYRKKRNVKSDAHHVLDAWLNKKEIKQHITKVDVTNYQKLQRQDVLGCVLNAINNDELLYAKKMWVQEGYFSIIKGFFQLRTVRDLKFLVLSSIFKLILFPVIGVFFKKIFIGYLSKLRI